jgi:SAM-dependent methyltransferase
MPNWRIKAYIQKTLSVLPGGHRMHFLFQTMMRSMRGGQGWIGDAERKILRNAEQINWISRHLPLEGAHVVEVGTGWLPVPTFLLYLAGAESILTFDIVPHVRFRLASMLIDAFRGKSNEVAAALDLPVETIRGRLDRLQGATSLDELFARANIRYVAPGDGAVTELPKKSVDLWYAYAVLQYVPQDQLRRLIREARRILKPSGRLYCEVECGDDFSSFDKNLFRFDYLRYGDDQWRRRAGNGFYVANRMREAEYLELFEQCEAVLDESKHNIIPGDIERLKEIPLHPRFAKFTPEQNAVAMSEMLFSFPPGSDS